MHFSSDRFGPAAAVLWASAFASVIAGCGSSTSPLRGPDACPSAEPCSDEDAGGGADAGANGEQTGAYEDDPYHCCGKGEGTSCCDGYKQGLCFQFGGLYRECRGEGQEIGGKISCAICCEGLDQVQPLVPSDKDWGEEYPKGCGPSATPPDLLVCIRCGDAVCGTAENFCNCPADCKMGG